MPAINLPTIDIDKEDFKSKETMEQILDTLIKYRKELNYLLMNLDVDNMPLVGGLIGDIEGDYSVLQQTVEGVQIQVGNQAGDISDLNIRADAITATVGDNAGNIGQLQVQANSIQGAVTDNAGDIATLTITAQGIQSQVTTNEGNISTVTQTAAGIQSQVTTNEGNISSVTQTAQGIQTQVTSVVRNVNNLDSEVGTLSSEITVVAGQVSSKVSYTDYNGVEIASLINQDARRITISAEALDLTGVTSIYGRYSGDYAQFDGSDFGIMVSNTQRFVVSSRSYGTGLYVHDGPLLSSAHGDTYFQRPITMHSNPTGSREGYNITSWSESRRCYVDATSSGVVVRDSYGSVLGSLFFG